MPGVRIRTDPTNPAHVVPRLTDLFGSYVPNPSYVGGPKNGQYGAGSSVIFCSDGSAPLLKLPSTTQAQYDAAAFNFQSSSIHDLALIGGQDTASAPSGAVDLHLFNLAVSPGRHFWNTAEFNKSLDFHAIKVLGGSGDAIHQELGRPVSSGSYGQSVLESSQFAGLNLQGQGVSSVNVNAANGENVSWRDITAAFSRSSAFVARGGFRNWQLAGFNFESTGYSGNPAFVPQQCGTTAGSQVVTVQDISKFAVGNIATIQGVAAGGLDLVSAIIGKDTSGWPGTITLADAVPVSTSGREITTATASNIVLDGSGVAGGGVPGAFEIRGCTVGGQGAGQLRYGINLAGFIGGCSFSGQIGERPCYDPYGLITPGAILTGNPTPFRRRAA